MQFNCEVFSDWKKRVAVWHSWFAWYPVFAYEARKTVWLETVERRLADYSSYTGDCKWDYRVTRESK